MNGFDRAMHGGGLHVHGEGTIALTPEEIADDLVTELLNACEALNDQGISANATLHTDQTRPTDWDPPAGHVKLARGWWVPASDAARIQRKEAAVAALRARLAGTA